METIFKYALSISISTLLSLKKLPFRVPLFSILAFYSISSSGAEQGWIYTAKVVKIVATFNGGVNVRLSPELTSCTAQSGYGPNYASLYPDHPAKNLITSVFLSAYITDRPVAIYLTDSTCKIGEVELGGR